MVLYILYLCLLMQNIKKCPTLTDEWGYLFNRLMFLYSDCRQTIWDDVF